MVRVDMHCNPQAHNCRQSRGTHVKADPFYKTFPGFEENETPSCASNTILATPSTPADSAGLCRVS